jgi:hypothetical protein
MANLASTLMYIYMSLYPRHCTLHSYVHVHVYVHVYVHVSYRATNTVHVIFCLLHRGYMVNFTALAKIYSTKINVPVFTVI